MKLTANTKRGWRLHPWLPTILPLPPGEGRGEGLSRSPKGAIPSPNWYKKLAPAGLGLLVAFALCCAGLVGAQAQFPFAPQTNPMAQRNAMNLVFNQLKWFQNTTRTSGSYRGGGYGMLVQQFQTVCDQYAAFKTTLTPPQLNAGANQLAELDAGLNIIAEAFTDYQTAVANGQSDITAFNNLRQVLNQAMAVWAQEFKRTCNQLRVGW